ncbi:MAG: hypothetical protein OHK0050_36550 [Roseiflexaceae bacterium]
MQGVKHMQAYRTETTIAPDGSLTITHIPLPAGEIVEVIILVQERNRNASNHYPLHGKPIVFDRPFEPVAEHDWEIQS